jgi:rhombotail lipoprotein
MKKLIALLWVGVSAMGCAAGFNTSEMREALQEERKLFSDDDDVTKIEQLKPQLKLPFRLAVAPLIQVRQSYWHEPRGMMEGEREEILAWGEKLKKEGIVSEFTMIPGMLLDLGPDRHRTSYIKSVRVAAARLQADAVLFLRCVTDTDSYANPLALLDCTIVGMFLVPGHRRDAFTILEGMIVDNRNQFLYFAADAEGTGSALAPLAMFDRRDAVADSRRNALRAFGEQLVRDGRRVLSAAPGVPGDTPGK